MAWVLPAGIELVELLIGAGEGAAAAVEAAGAAVEGGIASEAAAGIGTSSLEITTAMGVEVAEGNAFVAEAERLGAQMGLEEAYATYMSTESSALEFQAATNAMVRYATYVGIGITGAGLSGTAKNLRREWVKANHPELLPAFDFAEEQIEEARKKGRLILQNFFGQSAQRDGPHVNIG